MSKGITFRGQICSAVKHCSCGGDFVRRPHPSYGVTSPFCASCGDEPPTFKYKRYVGTKWMDFRHTRRGHSLTSAKATMELAVEIENAIKTKKFDVRHYIKSHGHRYRMRPISQTISHLIEKYLTKAKLPEEQEDFVRDFMAPFLGDVGAFAASEIHLNKFIRTFNFKDERKEWAQQVYSDLLGMNQL